LREEEREETQEDEGIGRHLGVDAEKGRNNARGAAEVGSMHEGWLMEFHF